MKNLNFIEKIQNKLYMKGGFSFNMEYGFNPPKEGYMVGGISTSLIFDNIEALSKGKDSILFYLNKYGALGECMFLGGWKDKKDGKIYIEPSDRFYTLKIALEEGNKRKQLAIYDLKKGKAIKLKEE